MQTVRTLNERIGETIVVWCSIFGHDLVEAKLHAVEAGGLWLETQKFVDLLHAEQPQQKDVTPVFFVPFSKIECVLSRAI